MLESVNLSLSLSKSAFKEILRAQQERLFTLSEQVYAHKLPVMIAFEGWDASGKGTNIRQLTRRLDPRGFKVLPIRAPMPHERDKPWLWRFWMHIPRHGQIAIFDRSWYGRVLVERVEGLTAIPDWIRAYEEINAFERTLAADGAVFVKFWLHISKAEQLRRFVGLTQLAETAWQVTADDWEQHHRFDDYVRAVEDMLANTNTPPIAPWTLVPATDKGYCQYAVFHTVIRRLEDALGLEPSPELAPEHLEAHAARAQQEKTAHKLEKKAAKETEKTAKAAAKLEKSQTAAGQATRKPKTRTHPTTKKKKKGIAAEAPAGSPLTLAATNGAPENLEDMEDGNA